MPSSPPPPPLAAPVQIGAHLLDPVARRLRRGDGVAERIGGRAFDLLVMLVERRDRVVPKSEIFDVVWPGLVVEENNLQVHVMALRRLLGAQAIVTVPGRGYRFVLPVAPADGAPAAPSTAVAPSDAAATPSKAADAPPAATPGNLPARLPPLYGRDDDLRAVAALLERQSLVTLVGAGGIGKTRVAQAAAHAARGRHADGAWLVELAPLAAAADVAPAIARTLGIALPARESEVDTLAAQLAARELLLVLDNCEHLLAAVVALVDRLLAAAPRLQVLATSQEPLRLAAERVYALDTLALPGSLAPLVDARRSGAIALFEARAVAIEPRFVLADDNLGAVVDICRRLDGIPLAIEMAAARLPLLGVTGVRDRLDARLRLLTGGMRNAEPRHQTMRATLEWSLALLSDSERRLLRRLGVFVGGFGLDAVRAVAADAVAAEGDGDAPAGAASVDELPDEDWELLDRLGVLVHKSLVVSSGGAAPRFRLLETVRAMALELLAAAGEVDALRGRHALWLRRLYDRADADHVALPNDAWRARYEPELDNLRAALAWAGEHDPQTAVALAATSVACWFVIGSQAEGLRHVEAVRRHVGEATPPAVAARYWSGIATLALRRTVPVAQAVDACERAIALFERLADRRQQYKLWCIKAYLQANAGEIAAARASVAQARAVEDPDWPPTVLINRLQSESAIHTMTGELALYLQAERQSARLYAAGGKELSELVALSNVADAQLALGQVDASILTTRDVIARRRARGLPPTVSTYAILAAALLARDALDDAEQVAREAVALLGGSLNELLDHVALLAALRGRLRDAARAAGCADAACARDGFPRQPAERRSRERLQGLIDAAIGDEAERRALADDGASLGEAQAIALAIG